MADNETRIRLTAVDDVTAKLNTIRGAVDGLTGPFTKLQSVLTGLGAAVGLTGLALTIKSAIDAQDEMGKLAQKVGIAVGELSQLKYAADLSGVSTEGLTNGIKTLAQRMTEAADATSKSGRLLKALGVDVSAGPSKAIDQIADAFAKLPDSATKSAVAVELFGRAGLDMIPFLNGGADGIARLKAEADKLGLTLSEDTTRAAEAFNDNLRAVKATGEALGISLVNAIAPALQRISQDMKNAAIEGGALKAILEGLRSTFGEIFFGDPQQNRVAEIRKEIALLEPMLEEAPELAKRVALLNKELEGLLAFQDAVKKSGGAGPKGDATGLRDALANAVSGKESIDTFGKELEALRTKVLAASSGLSADFPKAMAVFNAAVASGRVGLAEHAELMFRLIKQQPFYKQGLEEEARWLERRNELIRQANQDEVDAINARDAVLDRLESGNQALAFEVAALGSSTLAREKYLLKLEEERDLKSALDEVDEERIRALYRERDALLEMRQAREDQLSTWNELANRGANFFADLATNGRVAFRNLRDSLKDFARELLAIFAKRWLLNMGANLTGNMALSAAAGQVGQGTLAGSLLSAGAGWLGSNVPGFAAASEFGSAAIGSFVGPAAPGSAAALGQSAYALLSNPVTIAIAAAAAIAYYFRDKGENWRGRLGFGEAAQAYTTEGVFGTEGFQYIAGNDAVNRSIQAFMAATRPLDQQLALRLTPEQIDRITASLTSYNAPGARRIDGQPAEFAFGKKDDTAAGQLTLEYLQQKYGTIFDEIDSQFAAFIRGYTGTSEDLLAAIGEFASVLDGLDRLGVSGLNVDALRSFQQAGEELGATFARISEQWSAYQNLFLSDGEKLARAQQSLSEGFSALGISVPEGKEAFKALVDSLDLSTESGRTLFAGLMQLAPAFAAVTDAAAGMLASFDAIAGQMRPGYSAGVAQAGLEDATRRFIERNPWAQGQDWRYVAGQVSTITRPDFQAYSPESQGIILEILGYQQQLAGATESFATSMSSASAAVTDYASAMRAAREGLRDWAIGKLLGGNSPLLAGDRLNIALNEYQRALGSGDIGAFQGAADALLEQGRAFYASGEGYTEIFNRVLADAERLGGFSLGRPGGPVASIDQMRSELATELRLQREENRALRSQVDALIRAIQDGSAQQNSSTFEAADIVARAVVNAVETVAR